MKKIIFFLFCFHLALDVSAQDNSLENYVSEYTYIYKLQPEDVYAIHVKKKNKDMRPYLHTLMDSVLTKKVNSYSFPVGNYLIVYAFKEELKIEERVVCTIYPQLIRNGKDFQLIVLDERGNNINEAKVVLDGERIVFNSARNYYFKSDIRKSVSLKISYKGNFICGNIYVSKDRKDLEYYVSKLVVTGKRIVEKAKRQIETGYLITSKPMYRPGDTVKLKAIAYRSHRVYRKKMNLFLTYIQTSRGYKEVKTKIATVVPDADGNFLFSFKLNDTLVLGHYYTLSLESKKLTIKNDFLLKDYRLEDYTFTTDPIPNSYSGQDTVQLSFDAYDVFGNPLDEAKVHIELFTQRLTVKESMPDYIPFTIIDSTLSLTSGRNNRFIIPQHLLPKTAGTFLMDLSFTDAQHHSKKESVEFSIEDNSNYFAISREDSLTVIKHFVNGKSIPSSGVLFFKTEGIRQTIELPFKGYIHPYLLPKQILYKDQIYSLDSPQQQGPEFFYKATEKGYTISSANVNHIPFSYQLFRNKKCIAEGYTTNYSFQIANEDKRIYTIKANYFLNGYKETKDVYKPAIDGLTMTTNIPQYIKPGDTTSFTIKVTDKNNHPVKGLNITASALDTKFKSIHYPNYKYSRPGIVIPERDLSLLTDRRFEFSERANLQWQRIFNFDTSLYHHYMHPPRNGFYYYTDTHEAAAEFAPHVIDKGSNRWVYYIKIDDQPVYYSYYEYVPSQRNITAFSFTASPGYHRVSLRLSDQLIELDSVLFVSGKKLDLSIDIHQKDQDKCKVLKVGEKLSKNEIDQLNLRKVYVTNHQNDAVVADLGYTKMRIEKNSYIILFNDQPIVIAHKGKRDTVQMKGVNSIDIHDSGIFTNFDSKVKPVVYKGYRLGKTSNYGLSQQPRELLKMIYYTPVSSSGTTLLWPRLFYEQDKTSTGRGTFFLNNYVAQPWLSYSLVQEDSSFSFYEEFYPLIYNVKPGKYTLVVRYDSLHVAQQQVDIKSNELTTIDARYLAKDTAFISQTKKYLQITESFDKINPQIYKQEQNYRSYDQPDRPVEYRSSLTHSNSRQHFFNPMNRYTMFGGGLTMTQWDMDQTGFQSRNFISVEGFLARRYSSRITGELNLQYLHANQNKVSNHFVTRQLILSSFVYIDLFQNRGKYVKRLDWTPFLKTGFSSFFGLDSYSSNTVKPSWIQPMIPVGVGLRYKFAKYIDLSVSVVRYVNLLGGTYHSSSLASFNQLETGIIYIIPAKVLCPKFRDGPSGGRLYSVATTIDNNYIFENNVQSEPTSSFVKVRTSFNDLAYWQPALKTDAQGKVTYKVKFPEDITVWKNYIIGVGKHNQQITKVDYISAILPLTIKLNTPRFLIAEDSFTVYSQLLNATQQLGIDVHSVIQSGETIVTKDTLLIRKATVKALLHATHSDSLTVQGIVQSSTVGNDGELIKIPVLMPGVMNAKGIAFSSSRDTSFTFSTDSIANGKLVVNASAMDEMLKELDRLKDYPYSCMEQTASKLKGFLLLKSISKMKGQVFKGENDIQQLLKRLNDNQQPNGSWGWWSSGSDEVLAAYVTMVLRQADSMGYNGVQYKRSLEYLKRFEKDSLIKLDVLLTLSELNVPIDSNTLNSVQHKKYTNDMEAISRIRILQLNKRPYDIEELMALKKRHALAGSYWGGETWDWRTNQIPATLLAYKILKQHGGYENQLAEIRYYLYAIKENGHWRNTVETATIVDLLWRETKPASTPMKAVLTVNGKEETLPYVASLSSNKTYAVSYKTDQPVFVSYYMEEWNNHPEKEGNDFKIHTQFVKDGKVVKDLIAGEEYEMAVKVNVNNSASYVMIEVPLPAGCLPSDNYRRGEHETYRENFKEKTNIYLSHASIGSYTYYVTVKASYAGLYTLNPARVSLMYFPALFGQEGMKQVRIMEK